VRAHSRKELKKNPRKDFPGHHHQTKERERKTVGGRGVRQKGEGVRRGGRDREGGGGVLGVYRKRSRAESIGTGVNGKITFFRQEWSVEK